MEMSASKTFADLKRDLASRLGVDAAAIKIFKDDKFKQPLIGRDADSLTKLGLKNGAMLHVSNQQAQMTQLPPPPK